MSNTPCRDAFMSAQAARRTAPLQSGAYKLREAQWATSRMRETMYAIGEYLNGRGSYYPGAALAPCSTTDDKPYWIKNIPAQVADLLGCYILPAIAALTGDGIAETDVRGALTKAKADTDRLLDDCETEHKRLQAGIECEYRAMR